MAVQKVPRRVGQMDNTMAVQWETLMADLKELKSERLLENLMAHPTAL